MIVDVSNFCARTVNFLLFGGASLSVMLVVSFSVQSKGLY